ncbi:copper chaperone PCu(A)C [Paracoccus lutimaris]|uniref:Copper(I)-binding protein n=1 Tax=Paracoccus lutimaris TaxID=1490030 RepID=A0A368Z6R7_9RHOB|nr:copper chaperone PCu(A)C [Paracoccus lutimaris]RCW88113.1 hypothetical protein DFP89_10242 [Paracoccus lutimaris]
MKSFIPALAIALMPLAAAAEGTVSVHDGYARGANPKSGAAFMVIENAGTTACTLMGATSDAADKAELHTSRDERGVMKMVATGPIEIGPGSSHELARGGDHVMLMGLKAPLKDGETVPLVLDFGDCGLIHIALPVDNQRKPGAAGADDGDHAGHGTMTH